MTPHTKDIVLTAILFLWIAGTIVIGILKPAYCQACAVKRSRPCPLRGGSRSWQCPRSRERG